MRPTFQGRYIQARASKHSLGGLDMAGLAAMRCTGQCKFFRAKAEPIRRSTLDQRQRLDCLDGGARKHGPFDIAKRQHNAPRGVDHRDGTRVAAFHHCTARHLDENRITHS